MAKCLSAEPTENSSRGNISSAEQPGSSLGDISSPENVSSPAGNEDDITVVFSGMSGAGKSTLISIIMYGVPAEIDPSPKPVSVTCEKHRFKKNDVSVAVIDTPGLIGSDEEREKQIKSMINYTSNNVDLLVYCLSIDKKSKFCNMNPDIMRSLQKAFGVDVWKHCILLLTCGNEIWDYYSQKNHENFDDSCTFEKYFLHVHDFATEFHKELCNLGVQGIEVKTIFDEGPLHKKDQSTIVAIPTGLRKEDKVLFGNKDAEVNGWIDVVQQEMINSCKEDRKAAFKKYRDGTSFRLDIKKVAVASITGGIIIGGVVGAATAGPAGAVVGAKIGAKTGAVVGTLAGGSFGVGVVAATYKFQKDTNSHSNAKDKIGEQSSGKSNNKAKTGKQKED